MSGLLPKSGSRGTVDSAEMPFSVRAPRIVPYTRPISRARIGQCAVDAEGTVRTTNQARVCDRSVTWVLVVERVRRIELAL